MHQLVLSLFPGIGLLDRAFEEVGFCVVRGPDVLWGGDIRKFHPPAGRFDGVIGGPPCQSFSPLVHIVRHNGLKPKFGNLIPEFERCVAAAEPQWYLMENVRQAPTPDVDGYGQHSFLINNRQFGQTQNRLRRWSFGWRGDRRVLMVDTVALEPCQFDHAALGGAGSRMIPIKVGGSGKLKRVPSSTRSRRTFAHLCQLQGLPGDFLAHAPFTVEGKCNAVGNGVPMAMGRAMARAVREVIEGRVTQ